MLEVNTVRTPKCILVIIKNNLMSNLIAGEEVRQAGVSPIDPSNRRSSGQGINAGSLSKQKSPVGNDSTMSKDAMVSCMIPINLLSSSFLFVS